MHAAASARVLPLVLVCLAVARAPSFAQTLTGHTSDTSTGKPVSARIEVVETRQSTLSDHEGRFTVPVGDLRLVTLVVSRDGYYVLRLQVDTATAGSLELGLTPVVSLTDRIEVTATRAREGADPATFTNVPQGPSWSAPTGARTRPSCWPRWCRACTPPTTAATASATRTSRSAASARPARGSPSTARR